MNTLDSIAQRRSIRRFRPDPVPRALLEQLLAATVQAPSAKNVQPWRFVVLQGAPKDELVAMLQRRADALKAQGEGTGSLPWTAKAMAQAPVTIVILNAAPPPEVPAEAHGDWDWVMVQSTGGAIQTLLLAATDLGLGTLWICDILYDSEEVRQWLGHPQDSIVAAVSLGYADEAPAARPRRPWQDVTEWRG